jgi:hypothetical protein
MFSIPSKRCTAKHVREHPHPHRFGPVSEGWRWCDLKPSEAGPRHVPGETMPCMSCSDVHKFHNTFKMFFFDCFFDFHKNFKCVHHFPNTSDHSLSNDVHLQRHFHGFFQRFSYMFIWFMDIFHMFPLCSWSPLLSSTTHWAAFGKYQLLRHRETWHGLLENASFVIFSVYRLRLFDRLF